MEISTTQHSFYFTLFYVLAFVFLAFTVLYIGRKKGHSVEKLLLLLGALSLGTILGSRLATIPIGEWGNLMFTNEVHFLDRAASGGIIVGLLCLFTAYRVLHLSTKFLIHFIWIVPIGLSIQKIGCFLNGCCYGTPTTSSLGIVYPRYTPAHYNHWLHDQIDLSSPWSLSVHPVQLYEIMAMILIAALVWKTKAIWKKTWSALIFGLSMIFATRFITEFFRDGIGSQFGTETVLGLRYLHWTLLIVSILLGVAVFLNERNNGRSLLSTQGVIQKRISFGALELAVCLSFITFTFKGVFAPFEWWALWFTLIPAIIIFTWHQVHRSSPGKYHWWAFSAWLIPVWLIAQTVIYKDTTTVKSEKFHRIDIGANMGTFYNELLSNPNTTTNDITGCTGTSYTKLLFKSEYNTWGAGYSKVERKGYKSTTWGVNGYLGNIKSSILDSVGTYSRDMWGINPYAKYEGKWFGIGGGFHAGKLYYNKEESTKANDFSKVIDDKAILPEFYLRLGVRKYLDVDYNYGFLFPSPFPTTYSRMSIGTGLGQDFDYNLRYGTFLRNKAQFISAEALVNKNFGLQFMYIFKDDYSFSSELSENSSNKFVVSLNYRFGHQ